MGTKTTCANPHCREPVQRDGARCETCAHFHKIAKQRQRRNQQPPPTETALTEATKKLETAVSHLGTNLTNIDEQDVTGHVKEIENRAKNSRRFNRQTNTEKQDILYLANTVHQLHNILTNHHHDTNETLNELQLWTERINNQPEIPEK